jgi:hypothetical protein
MYIAEKLLPMYNGSDKSLEGKSVILSDVKISRITVDPFTPSG